MSTAAEQIERLIAIMAKLRASDGCPWDKEQDLASLRPYLIEEAFEVLDAMDDVVAAEAVAASEARPAAVRELCVELGDLLFQIVFQAQLARERGEFELADVIRAICDKIESRHPHVFGGLEVSGPEEVLRNWAQLKADERRQKGQANPSALEGVPREAPALLRAERLTEKASRVGFDWKDWTGPRAKVDEELRELDEALQAGDRAHIEDELGDVLFALCNLARFTRTPPEDALRKAIRRFEGRFRYIENALRLQSRAPSDASIEELDALWDEAKRALRDRSAG